MNISSFIKPIDNGYFAIFVVVFVVMFVFCMNYIAPTPLPIGLNMPANAAVWLCISFLILISIFKIIHTQSFKYSIFFFVIVIMSIFTIVPGLINTESEIRDIILRILQVCGFLLTFVSIFQFRFTQRKINLLFYLILFSALIQIIYALAQIYFNNDSVPIFLYNFVGKNNTPIGGIGQINALSIYLATSILISLYLYLQPSFLKQPFYNRLLIFLVIIGGSYIVFLNSSRVAIISLLIAVPLMLYTRRNVIKIKLIWGVIFLLGLFIGSFLGFQAADNKLIKKTINPRTIVWNITAKVIIEKPIFGHGLGGYSKAFFDINEKHVEKNNNDKTDIRSFFTHPHNELLYWWVESGLLAVIAIIFAILIYLFLLMKNRISYVLQFVALLLPISLHTQASLPFYLSTILMVLFILLLVIPIRRFSKNKKLKFKKINKLLVIVVSIGCFMVYAWFIGQTIKGGKAFVTYTNSGENDYQVIANELSNPYWGKLASVYTNIDLLRKELNLGNREKAELHLKWLEDFTINNESPMYYQVLLAAYKMMGDEKYTPMIKRLKNRHYYYFKDVN